MEKIRIGKVVNAVALKGEVKIYHYSDCKERFEELDHVLLEKKGDFQRFEIEKIRYQNDLVILKFKGVDDRNSAESLKERDVYITEEELSELPEDTFYIRDLIGCKVIDGRTETEAQIGVISDVIQGTAQDIYQVKLENGKETLIPAVQQFIKEVNIEKKYIKVELIEGFID